jgi:competence protein ComEC
MRCAIIGFALGIGMMQMQATLPERPALLLGSALLLALGLLHARLARIATASRWLQTIKIALAASCGALFGVLWASGFAHHYLDQALPLTAQGRDISVIGTIDSLPYRFRDGVRFNFAVEQVLTQTGDSLTVPPRISLSWYNARQHGTAPVIAAATSGIVAPGERWQLTVRLQRPHGNANPQGFDYEVWLLEQGLRATGYVRTDGALTLKNQRLAAFVPSFGNLVERSRSWLRQRILAALPDQPYAGVIVALVIGDQRAVSQSDWAIFNRTGIGHLISISGLHITMIAGIFASLTAALWRRSFFTDAQLPLRLPAQKAAALVGVGVALLYVLLAGFGVPAQRTLYMLTVVAAALWLGRITSVSHVLCAALALVLLLDPWAVLWPGFWLSFGAVAIILYASVGRTEQRRAQESTGGAKWLGSLLGTLHAACKTQYVVTLGLIPLTMLLFGQISLLSPLANAIAIPLISFLVTPLALLGCGLPDPLSGWLLNLAHFLVHCLANCLTWISFKPYAVWSAPQPPLWIFLLALCGSLWLLAPRGWPLRRLGLIGLIPLALHVPRHPAAGQMWVTAFDVGQGMALLIETEHHRLLYDSGPFYSLGSDGGNRVIVPYLNARGINHLDAMIITHNDNDHSGGAISIMQNIRVGWVASSLAATSPIVLAAPQHRHCQAGQSWIWDGVRFDMLHPMPASYGNAQLTPNARSCTLKLTADAGSILLAGDIGAKEEQALLERDRSRLQSNVLLAPHHGSGTSSTSDFLRAVHPQLALFQVGYRNRYHHPKPEIFARYGALGVQRLRSDEAGAITIQFGPALQASAYRSEHARYWHGR